MSEPVAEQLALVRERAREHTRAVKEKAGEPPAATAPVARVAVDVPLPHLDRPFDYLVPAAMDADAQPGVRVRVRFAGQLVDGFLLERAEVSEHVGALARLQRVVSPEPVLTPELLALAREVAARWAGTLADVLRLAIPPRHARAEQAAPPATPPPLAADQRWAEAWADYEPGASFVRALAERRAPRAVWAALPGADPYGPIAAAVATTAAAGRGALVVVPDARELRPLGVALDAVLGPGRHVALTADLGPAERYKRWLAVRRGQAQVVIGTRAAMFAPVVDLGLVVCWDDGDDLHAEPRAPYPHVREVLCMRAHNGNAAALFAGYAVTAEAAGLVQNGWARMLIARRDALRAATPAVRIAGSDAELARDGAARAARLPSEAWQAARAGLAEGPVLIQVPRRGYLPVVACVRCRTPARCAACHGPLGLGSAESGARCGWCGRDADGWRCPECAANAFRASVIGTARTAEELGRAFPDTPVRMVGPPSTGEGAPLSGEGPPEVPATPALVVATPGAEPVAAGGYAAALLLDGNLMLARADLRAAEETLRRWLNAAALVRPGGAVVLMADAGGRAAQALLRWDPFGFATHEIGDRGAAGFPPAVRLVTLTGPADAINELLALATLPAQTEMLGPVALTGAAAPAKGRTPSLTRKEDSLADARGVGGCRAVLRAPRSQGAALSAALHAAAGVRSARKSGAAVRIQVDPVEIG
jgi:primosomal protein N' (replication factor Y)